MRTLFFSSVFLTLLVVGWSAEYNPSLLLSWGNDGQTNIKDTQIYNTFARVFGAPRVFSTFDKSQSANDLFNKPPRNLFFSLEGVAPDRKKLTSGSVIDVAPTVIPYSAFSTIASAVTGVTHSVLSFDSDAIYWTGNLFDSLLQLHKKEYTIISASSCRTAAKLVSPHRESLHSESESLYWDTETGKYSSIFGDTSSFGITREDFPALLSKLSSLLKSNSMDMKIEGSFVRVQNNDKLVFLDLQEDEIFFAEILFVLNFGDIKTPSDWLTFYFKSAKMISDKYGESSDRFLVAVSIIDIVIEDLIKKMKDDKREYNYAVLYLPNAQPQIETEIQKRDVQNFYATTSKQDVERYQMAGWTALLMVIAVILAFYYFNTMDKGEDSMLYRSSKDANLWGTKDNLWADQPF